MGTVKTAIPGLDELIEGGYIESDKILINTKVKNIEILKMRGVKHDDSLHPYEIQDKGIK